MKKNLKFEIYGQIRIKLYNIKSKSNTKDIINICQNDTSLKIRH